GPARRRWQRRAKAPSPPSQACHEVPDAFRIRVRGCGRASPTSTTKTPMSHIKSRKHALPGAKSPQSLTAATLLTSLALGVPASAVAADVASGPEPQTTTLDKVDVHGERIKRYSAETASPKFTQPLQDTPQTIQVIGSDLFNEQGATTLTEALRNSPGVGTFYAGENGNTSTGDGIYMRGFDSS